MEARTSAHSMFILKMFDTDRFICEIKLRPAIYNVTLKEYGNKHIKAKCWKEVGEAMYENWSSMTYEEKDEKGKYSIDLNMFVIHKYDNTVFGNIKIWVGCQMFLSYYIHLHTRISSEMLPSKTSILLTCYSV